MLTHAELLELLDYDLETGKFYWRRDKKGSGAKVGKQAGNVHKLYGYRRIKLNGVAYRAHRLAWLYVYGTWPEQEIDHINGDRDDNRIINLRDVDHTTNCQNKNGPTRHNKSGFLGVSYQETRTSPKKYQAKIRRGDKTHHIGYFLTPEEAHEAYTQRRQEMEKAA